MSQAKAWPVWHDGDVAAGGLTGSQRAARPTQLEPHSAAKAHQRARPGQHHAGTWLRTVGFRVSEYGGYRVLGPVECKCGGLSVPFPLQCHAARRLPQIHCTLHG